MSKIGLTVLVICAGVVSYVLWTTGQPEYRALIMLAGIAVIGLLIRWIVRQIVSS